ncbi:hypothetical protein HYV44_00235 [Candidatus Microgenomates bacterium]|nr:hypothetical protein [Candidatus Microgenomates bacterium]
MNAREERTGSSDGWELAYQMVDRHLTKLFTDIQALLTKRSILEGEKLLSDIKHLVDVAKKEVSDELGEDFHIMAMGDGTKVGRAIGDILEKIEKLFPSSFGSSKEGSDRPEILLNLEQILLHIKGGRERLAAERIQMEEGILENAKRELSDFFQRLAQSNITLTPDDAKKLVQNIPWTTHGHQALPFSAQLLRILGK